MKNKIQSASLFVFLFIGIVTAAQPKNYSPANAHSHNDYLNDTPFYRAYAAGFGSIEADVFPVNGALYVAHSKNEIQPQRTLKAMYLDPLLKAFLSDSIRRLKLLIDVKENYQATLPILIQELQPLRTYLATPQTANRLTVLISGTRPPPAEYKNYPDFVFFDDDLKQPHTTEQWNRVGLVSLPFTKLSIWKGEGALPSADERLLQHTIDSVHAAGKPIRFWAAPDTKASWTQQMKWRVDLIGTDKVEELGALLKNNKD